MRESVVLKYGARSRCRVRRSHFFRLCNRRLDYLSIVASMDVVAHGASAERRRVVLRGILHSGTFLRVLPFLLKRKGPPCGFSGKCAHVVSWLDGNSGELAVCIFNHY